MNKTRKNVTRLGMAGVGLTGIAASALFAGGYNHGVGRAPSGTQNETQSAALTVNTAFENAASMNAVPMNAVPMNASQSSGRDAELGVHARTTKLEVSMLPKVLVPNKMATWTLRVLDKKSGRPVQAFATEMTKLMHLIVVRRDLSWFNHIHPIYKGNGVFVVSAMVPRTGSYKLYADYIPKDRTQEVPQYAFNVGAASPAARALRADKPDAKGWMTQMVVSHPEGQPNGAPGATYQVALMPMPGKLVSGQNVMLHFQVRDAKGRPIKDLQPYLGTMGHMVVLSSNTNIYLHAHPMSSGMGDMAGMKHDMGGMKMDGGAMDMSKMNEAPAPKSGGPDVMFHTNFPTAGLYKAWGQFRHKGQVITSSFVVNVGAAKAGAASNAAQDESMPHSH